MPYVTEVEDGQTLRLLRAGLPLSALAWSSPGHRLPEPAAPFPSTVQVAGPGLRAPFSRQFSIGWTQELGHGTSLSVDGVVARGERLLGIVDYNPLVPALGPGRRPEGEQAEQSDLGPHAGLVEDPREMGLRGVPADAQHGGRIGE